MVICAGARRRGGRSLRPPGRRGHRPPRQPPQCRPANLGAWDDEATQRADLTDATAALRGLLTKPTSAERTTGPRKPREATKQQQVLAVLRRPEGATVAQIAAATSWANHTVRGFFAGLKKHGIEVEAAERVRQASPGKEGAKGSYTIYRVSEAAQG
jgi:hypothetical protein